MALSPADFYAYSRATGAQVPEDPQERAEMAPEVLEFRRNQLKAPQQSPNVLQAVGATALAGAAALGAGLAARHFMRGRGQIPKGPPRSATQGVVQQDLSALRRAAAAEPAARPVAQPIAEPVAPSRPAPGTTENALPVDPTDRLLEELGQMQASRKHALETRMSRAYGQRLQKTADELLTQLATQGPDLTDIQQATRPAQVQQFAGAVESGEDQMSGRIKTQLQRNEDYDMSQVEMLENIAAQNQHAMMEGADPSQVIGYEADAPINQAASQLPDGSPVDQSEGARSFSSQELADMAKEEMISLRQDLEARGLRPGTQRFERALSQTWTNKSIPGAAPGTEKFRELQEQGKVDISLPGFVRKAVDAESAGAGPMGLLPERTVLNIGPEAKITFTAAGTAIRGASPSSQEVLPIVRTRQVTSSTDPLVFGVPDEDVPDLPGALRLRGGAQPEAEPDQLSRQEIKYSVLDRPIAPQAPGGAAGVGVYGIEPAYVPGAMSKTTGQYSAASAQQPTYVPGWLQKKEMSSGFEALTTPQLMSAAAKTTQGSRIQKAFQSEIERRQNIKKNVALSEVLRRGKIEGLDTQGFLNQQIQNLGISAIGDFSPLNRSKGTQSMSPISSSRPATPAERAFSRYARFVGNPNALL